MSRATVTIVIVAYNRREKLRESLRHTFATEFGADRFDVIVIDNASTDGTAAMVRDEFPQIRLIERDTNIGAPAWNEGLAMAGGDYVLILDDDCYLPPDGLGRAVEAAERAGADLVSFKVVNATDPAHDFTQVHRMGFFMFWGCAALIRRDVLNVLGGYDPEIFMLVNELEFTLRFFDRGFRHLHLPEVAAQHMKAVADEWIIAPGYRLNYRHYAYVVAKLLARRDALEALGALIGRVVRDAIRTDPMAMTAVPHLLRGFAHGLRHRAPVANATLSRFYRHNFETLASPWWLTRTPADLLRALPGEILGKGVRRGSAAGPPGRLEQYFAERAAYYPERAAVLEFVPDPRTWEIDAS
jgi:GT2 family glycosyltransferase